MSVEETIATYDRISTEYAHRWQDRTVIAREIARFLALLPQGGTVLDVGCGPGFDCVTLSSHGLRVLGVDLSWGMLQAGRAKGYPVQFIQADMRRLPLGEAVAGVWCNAALLHLSRHDSRLSLQEFHRVLQPNGVLFVAVKEGQGELRRSETYGSDNPRYFTYWQQEHVVSLMASCGFAIESGTTSQGQERRWLTYLARKIPQDR